MVQWMKMGRNTPARTPDNPYNWAPRTINGILEKQEYLGHMVNFKTRKLSYKSKKKLENTPEQWKSFENTQEAIIVCRNFARTNADLPERQDQYVFRYYILCRLW